jgi:iron complex transport system substrate-binding protein
MSWILPVRRAARWLAVLWLAAGARTLAAAPPERIIAFSPNLTEIIFLLGAGGRVVGVTDFCELPAAEAIPRVGGPANPNFEMMTALRPDLIVTLGQAAEASRFARERGIPVESIDMDSLATIRTGIARLGEILDARDAATSLTTRMDARLAVLARRREVLRGTQPPPRVFLSLMREPGRLAVLYTVSGGTFLNEALEWAGGANIFSDIRHSWPQISKETLLVRRPEVILELAPGRDLTDTQADGLAADWDSLPALPAVRDGRVHVLSQEGLLIAGPGFPGIVEAFQNALYPAADAATSPTPAVSNQPSD